MAQFALYHYELRARSNKNPLLFDLKDPQRQFKTMENLFESFLPARGFSLGVQEAKTTGRGDSEVTTYEPHESEVLQNKNHIIAFKVQKNGKKKIKTVNWNEDIVEHHPVVRVLIDNRPDRQLIAIENKSDFKAEKAFELMKNHFNLQMRDYYVCFECYPLLKKAEFWESVNEIKHRFNDFIRRVQFDFVGGERTGKGFTDGLSVFLDTISAANGILTLNFKGDDQLERAKEDITHMADLCYRNKGYNLSVKFRDFGTFCFGQDIKAQWGLDDEKIDAFSEKYTQMDMYAGGDKAFNDIAEWFDKINDLFSDYINNGMKEYHNFDNYIVKKSKSTEIKQRLHEYMDGKTKPMDVLIYLAAALSAGCLTKPSLDDFNAEFKKEIAPTSYNRYVKVNTDVLSPYAENPAFKTLIEEFREL